jgi:glycine betaine/proline transport system permease protein
MWEFLKDPFEHLVIPLGEWVGMALAWLVANFRGVFQLVRWPIDQVLGGIEGLLMAIPPFVIIIIFLLISWQFAQKRTTILVVVSLFVMGIIGAWAETMVTLSLMLTAVFFCAVIGFPLGVFASRSDRFEASIRPILDAMQTTPAFVYLIPIVMLFGIGNVPGVVVTIIFALPPLVRLTNLGLRQVPPDVVEATAAFGGSPRQILFKVQIPLAMPTIMAGLNQSLMMSLSMVVIASMIAVGGLGQMVLRGIGRLDMGLATVGGIGIVLLAIVLDRLMQAAGAPPRERGTRHWYDRGPARLILNVVEREREA